MTVPLAERLDGRAVAALVGCCALWGLNQVAIKAAVPEVPSLVQLSIRSIVALALLAEWMRRRGLRFDLRDGSLGPGLLAGALFAAEFACIFVGLQHTTAARSTVFINTSPFVVALLLAWLLPGERLAPLQLAGLLLAFGGVAYAFAEPAPQSAAWPWLGDALVLAAAPGAKHRRARPPRRRGAAHRARARRRADVRACPTAGNGCDGWDAAGSAPAR